MATVIELKNVSKSFRVWDDRPNSIKTLMVQAVQGRLKTGRKQTREVLDKISFRVEAGEFLGIMGRNGAGKSTLMKLIAGIYVPTSGEIKVNGRVAPLLELGAGFAEDLSGLDNIYLNASVLGYSNSSTRQNLAKIIEFSELGEAIHSQVKKYSSGMLVRLGFSIAAHLEAPILLFDEILAVGDEGFQKKCLVKIRDLNKQGRAIILITHSTDQVREHCKRCILLDQQKIVYDGPVERGTKGYSDLFV